MPKKTDYTWQNPRSRFVWFRMKVPKEFQSIAGRQLITFSLKTTDKRQAAVLAGRHRAELFDQWQAIQSPSADKPAVQALGAIIPTNREMMMVAHDVYQIRLKHLEEREVRLEAQASDEAWQKWLDRLDTTVRGLVRKHGKDFAFVQRLTHGVIERRSWHLPKGSEGYGRLTELLHEAITEAFRIRRELDSGNLAASSTAPNILQGKALREASAAPGQSLLQLFDLYAQQRETERRKNADGIAQDRYVIESFVELVGAKRNIRSIEKADVREWRDLLGKRPANAGKLKQFVGLTLREIAAKADGQGLKSMAPKTINRYLSALSALFKWSVEQGYADSNPCEGLFYDLRKIQNRRSPFSDAALRSVIGSPLFTGFQSDTREHLKGSKQADDWRYWIPLLCLFTGARIGELAQLRICDVKKSDDIWFIEIVHDPAQGLKTKAKVTRPMAIHSKLVELGFIDFWTRRKRAPSTSDSSFLFPETRPKSSGGGGKDASKWWRRYLTRIGVKDGADGLGSHSFRHSLADRLRDEDVLDSQIAIALGHSVTSTTSRYGQKTQGTVRFQKDMIEKVTFDGIGLEKLPQSLPSLPRRSTATEGKIACNLFDPVA